MSALERIQQETEQWFLTEPLFFTVYCSHRLTINPNMLCALRSGQGRIEYNPELIDSMPDHQLRALLSVEMIRILLKHPYSRQPLGCPGIVLKMASDMVIAPAYNLTWAGLIHPEEFGLPTGQHFEWYANRLSAMGIHMDGPAPSEGDSCADGEAGEGGESSSSEPSEKQGEDSADGGGGENKEQDEQGENAEGASSGGADSEESNENAVPIEGLGGMPSSGEQEAAGVGGTSSSSGSSQTTLNTLPPAPKRSEELSTLDSAPSSDYTSLWEEDAFMGQQITDIIHSTTQWGSLPGGMVELIQKAAEGKIDYRNALRAFRSSILSQKRHLTRMYPSRRFGFEQMGSRYEFTTRLLVAIDTSGSVGSDELGRYYRIITTFFKYGIQEIDVLMFDFDVQGEPVTLKEAQKNKQTFEVKGRGGTNFQAPVNYVAEHPDYDGLIIMTDGYAPIPSVPAHLKTKLLWVIDNELSYKQHYDALRKTGRVCLIEL
ncbi:MAG: VWA-like domain-containing protein [Prevotellaceae bacterium]|nr:VWA-like domain-containing protein [Prevotellaceae bacterium]